MTRNAEKGGTARRVASAVVGLAMLAGTPALAGDAALIDYLGYSSDGRYFAFEEYGIQDGSGFPYSNVFVVDLATDRWVSGTPVRVLLQEDFESDLDAARAESERQAGPLLDRMGIHVPAQVLAMNADGDPRTGDGKVLAFGRPGFGLSDVAEVRWLALESIPLPSGFDCAIIEHETYGFILRLDGRVVHRDTGTIPRSRGCVMDYRLYAVLQPIDYAMAPQGLLAVISVYPFGFEGPDRRFIVVPLE